MPPAALRVSVTLTCPDVPSHASATRCELELPAASLDALKKAVEQQLQLDGTSNSVVRVEVFDYNSGRYRELDSRLADLQDRARLRVRCARAATVVGTSSTAPAAAAAATHVAASNDVGAATNEAQKHDDEERYLAPVTFTASTQELVRGLDCVVVLNRVLSFLDGDALYLMSLRRTNSTFKDCVENYSSDFWKAALNQAGNSNDGSNDAVFVDERLHRFFTRVFYPLITGQGSSYTRREDFLWLARGLADSGFPLLGQVVRRPRDVGTPILFKLVEEACYSYEHYTDPDQNPVLAAIDYLLTHVRQKHVTDQERLREAVAIVTAERAPAEENGDDDDAEFAAVPPLINTALRDGTTLLNLALKRSGPDVVRLLLRHGADIQGRTVNGVRCESPAFVAVEFNKPAELRCICEFVRQRTLRKSNGDEAAAQRALRRLLSSPPPTRFCSNPYHRGPTCSPLKHAASVPMLELLFDLFGGPCDRSDAEFRRWVHGTTDLDGVPLDAEKVRTTLVEFCDSTVVDPELIQRLLDTGCCDVRWGGDKALACAVALRYNRMCAFAAPLADLLMSQPGFNPKSPDVVRIASATSLGYDTLLAFHRRGVELSAYGKQMVGYRLKELREAELREAEAKGAAAAAAAAAASQQ